MADPLFPLAGRSTIPVDWTITEDGAEFTITAPTGQTVTFSTTHTGSMMVRASHAALFSLRPGIETAGGVTRVDMRTLHQFALVFRAIVTPDISAAANAKEEP